MEQEVSQSSVELNEASEIIIIMGKQWMNRNADLLE